MTKVVGSIPELSVTRQAETRSLKRLQTTSGGRYSRIIKLENQSDLEQASQLVSWLKRPTVDKVIVSLPWLDEGQRARIAKKMKFLFNDCGCLWGAPVFLVTFSSLLFSQLHASGFSWASLAVSFLFGAAAALSAKLLGLAWSCWRLNICFRKIMFF